MSLLPTSTIRINTSKGEIVVDLFAKEVPVVKPFLLACLNGELADKTVAYNDNQLVTIAMHLPHKRTQNSRIPFNKGAVAVGNDVLVINLADGIVVRDDLTVIGKITGQTIYTLNKVKNAEFDCIIKGIDVPVAYFDEVKEKIESRGVNNSVVGDLQVQVKGTGVNKSNIISPLVKKEKSNEKPVKKAKKAKVKVTYEEEDGEDEGNGFKMISSYDKRGKEEKREREKKVQSLDRSEGVAQENVSMELEMAREMAREIVEPVVETAVELVPAAKLEHTSTQLAKESSSTLTKPLTSPTTNTTTDTTTNNTTNTTVNTTAPTVPTTTSPPYNDIPLSKLLAHTYSITPKFSHLNPTKFKVSQDPPS